jgi:hypothetical protein
MQSAMHVRLLAERLLGEMLIAAKQAGQLKEGRPQKTLDADESFNLQKNGISWDLSSRAQKFAVIPVDIFEKASS